MNEYEKYEELIRQKFAEKEFIFNEENWEKAEKMIDSAKKSKMIFRWSSIFLIGVITGSCIVFCLNKTDHPKPEAYPKNNKSIHVTDHKQHLQGGSIENNSYTEQSSSDASSSSAQIFSPIPGNITTSNETRSVALHNEQKINNGDLPSESMSPYLSSNPTKKRQVEAHGLFTNMDQATAAGMPQGKNKALADKNTVTGVATNKMEARSENQETTDSLSIDKQALTSKSRKRKSAMDKKNALLTNTSSTAAKPMKGENNASGKNTATSTALALNKQPKSSGDRAENNKPGSKANASLIKGNLKKDNNPAKTEHSDSLDLSTQNPGNSLTTTENVKKGLESVTDSVKQEEKKEIAATDSVTKADSAVAIKKALEPSLPVDGLASGTLISIDAGAHAHLGWNYNDTIEARGVTPIAGIGITHFFNQKWSFYVGAQYNCIAYLNASVKNTSATTYSFGAKTVKTTVKPGILNYVVVPISVRYHFNERNAIFIGGTGGILINRKNEIEQITSYVMPTQTATSNSSVPYEDYYSKSFNRFDASVDVGYRRKLVSRFSITAMVNFGLSDVKSDAFFLRKMAERNSGLKLILSYNLFDF